MNGAMPFADAEHLACTPLPIELLAFNAHCLLPYGLDESSNDHRQRE